MALSEDSRTLLQLLLGRGKSYGDIAGLLGIDEGEVRARAHRALTEINGDDPDRDVPLTDYLLGQSDPLERADVARQLAENEAAAETAADLSDQLRLLVPGASLPRAGSAAAPAKAKSASSPKRARRVTPTADADADGSGTPDAAKASGAAGLTGSQRRLIAILIFVALLVVVGVLLLTDAFGGDDESEPPAPSVDNAGAVMKPVGGQEGTGKVQFGRVDENFAANLQFSDLTPSTKKDSYILWMNGSIGAYPLSEVSVDKSGTYSDTITLPPETLCSIATGVFTDLSLSRISQAEGARIVKWTERALRGKKNELPDVSGKVAFAGPVALDDSLRKTLNQQCQTPASASE